MSKIDFHSPKLSTEDDLKSIASYAERKDFVRSHFDKNYTGTTKENETLLRNPEFKKAYLEKFAHIRSESQDEREKLLKDRPEKNSYIQNVRE
jgi:hypothetical protein